MTIKERIEAVRERIEKAALRAGRKGEDIFLMAVSKFHGPESVREAIEAGLSLFGESRVQEALEKFPPIKKKYPLKLHMIGRLQRNKARQALELFDCVQSIDRNELIMALGKNTGEKPLDLLLELHTGEESKTGFSDFDSLCRAAETVLSFSGLRLAGLMTMAPFTSEEAPVRSSFRALVSARDRLLSRFPEADLSCLSMGMSNDFETAVEEGSTLLRIGTALFGERKP